MKTVISLGLVILCCGIFVFCFISGGYPAVTETVKAQTKALATPCPSPAKPSNTVDPCRPLKPPSAEEIVERERRAEEWEIWKKKNLTADFPLTSAASSDADGDGKADKILYQIKPWKNDFEGLLKITSAKGKVLWEHEFFISSRDLAEWLGIMYETEKREVTITTWVSNAFNEKYNYSFLSEKRKIKKSEIDAEQIDYAAKLNKISANKLKAEILAQKVNRIFTYRAEWREDLMQIVYIPSLKKFVCFTRGY